MQDTVVAATPVVPPAPEARVVTPGPRADTLAAPDRTAARRQDTSEARGRTAVEEAAARLSALASTRAGAPRPRGARRWRAPRAAARRSSRSAIGRWGRRLR